MKLIGGILITVGLALLLFVAFNLIKERNRTVSPVPEDNGVKVIFVTPVK